MSKSPRTSPVSTQAKGVRRISSKTHVLGDKAVILLVRFLKAERSVGQGVLQDSYGRMGKMGPNPDIERLSHRSPCLFSLPPPPCQGAMSKIKMDLNSVGAVDARRSARSPHTQHLCLSRRNPGSGDPQRRDGVAACRPQSPRHSRKPPKPAI